MNDEVAVLTSGGLDSSVLLANLATTTVIHPIYVRFGLPWEDQELDALSTFIQEISNKNVNRLIELQVSMSAVYENHWALTEINVPVAGDPDDSVFLPGRNIILLSMAATWCSTNHVHNIAIGSLSGNPFPDASHNFFGDFERSLSQGLAHKIMITAPYRSLTKPQIIRQNQGLPIHLTLTCMVPKQGAHCGECQKCEERQMSFKCAGVTDLTDYRAPLC